MFIEKIQVIDANDVSRLDLHKMYYIEGMRKSPIYPTYESSLMMGDLEKTSDLIIFIDSYESRYIFNCENSYERIDNLEMVINLIKIPLLESQ